MALKVYKKVLPGSTDPNTINHDGEKWYEVFADNNDELDWWLILNNDDIVVENTDTGDKKRVRVS